MSLSDKLTLQQQIIYNNRQDSTMVTIAMATETI